MSRTYRPADLWRIASALFAVCLIVWSLGAFSESLLLQFAGFMTAASTFVPLPADAYVLHSSAQIDAATIGLVGGLVNVVAVVVERDWILRLMEHPVFDRFREFIGSNRFVDAADRHLFVGLVVGGFSFLPFEPFRLMAVVRDYPLHRYAFATFLGRGFRYYWLARAGSVFAVYGLIKLVVWVSLIVFSAGVVRSYLQFRSAR